MGNRAKQKRTKSDPGPRCAPTLAKPVAGEDLCVGDYLAVLECTYEVPSFVWCGADAALLPPDEPVRLRMAPPDSGTPLRVESVCLPFAWVKHPKGVGRSLDLRRCRVAKLDDAYARAAWKAHRSRRRSKRKRR